MLCKLERGLYNGDRAATFEIRWKGKSTGGAKGVNVLKTQALAQGGLFVRGGTCISHRTSRLISLMEIKLTSHTS